MKKIFSILIALLILISWGTVIYRNGALPKAYSTALDNVRQTCDEGYYVEAQALLDDALLLQGNASSYDADVLQRDIYKGLNADAKYINQLREMIKNYPDQAENYEMMVEYYFETESFRDLCDCLDEYAGIWPDSKVIQNISTQFEHQYRMKNTGYYDVAFIDGNLVSIQEKEYEKDSDTDELFVNRKITTEDGSTVFDRSMKEVSVSVDENMFFICDQEGQWTLVDSAMNLIARNEEVQFDWIGRQGTNGVTPAVINGEYHYINRKMVPNDIVWDSISAFQDDKAAVCLNGAWAFATTDTLLSMTEFPYRDIAINDSGYCTVDGMAVVADDRGYCVFDTEKMEPVSEERYEEMKAFNVRQPAAYRDGNKWGFVSPDGSIFIDAEYEDAKSYLNGYAAVKKNGLWGIINRHNEMVVEPQFVDVLNVMDNGYVIVQNEEGRWDIVIIDKLYYAG